ncbi:hypothetical protein SLEP1_g41434 [Rubroshorea leprosula]|uniref:Uncharacterized protein n=1 Tax=Rubroshorea leprosula TaxID=152421 RepID=A0AAV5L6M4_9ROSI|nr:hypothetical protein SLEP1_g41434 [Rubroshorea leprosula]
MPKSTIIRATSYGARVRAKFEVGFKYLSEVLLMRDLCAYRATMEQDQKGQARIWPSLSPFNQVKVARCWELFRPSEVVYLGQLGGYDGIGLRCMVAAEVKGSMTGGCGICSSSSSGGGSGGRTSVSGGNRGQGDSIVPTNILKVDGSRAKCYDEGDEIVGEVIGPARSEERACSAPKDHWMPLYAHYLATGLWFPIPELLVALLKEYGFGLTQLVPNGVRLVGVSRKEKGWFYFTPRVAGGRSRNLFMAGPSSVKGWKEKFFFVDDMEWGRGDGKVEELSRWKGKRRNPNQYRLGEVEKDEVERLERGGGKLTNIMCLTSPEVVESSGIYGRSSLNGEEMNHLRAGGKVIRLPEKRSKASASGAQEERVGGGISRPHPGGGPRAEVGPSSKPMRGPTEEVTAWKRPRVKEVQPLQIEAPIEFIPRPPPNFYESWRTAAKLFIGSHFPEVDLQRARDEVATNGGSRVVRQALERKQCEEELARRDSKLAEVKKSAELAVHNSVEQHVLYFVKSPMFAEVVDLYRLPTLVMAFTDCRKKVKLQNLEVDVTNITFGPKEAGVKENGDSKTVEFRPEVKLTWERDEAGKTILPPTLDFEFIIVDKEEAEVAPRTKVADNVRDEEVDQ